MLKDMTWARGLGVALASAAAVVAQSDRTMSLPVPASVGGSLLLQLEHPAAASGNPCWFLLAPRFRGAYGVIVAPFAWNGRARLDLGSVFLSYGFVLDLTGSLTCALAVPADPAFLGFQFDAQTLDLDVAPLAHPSSDHDRQREILGSPPAAHRDPVAVPAGTFVMGDDSGPPEEQPAHLVTISRPFWIWRTEVTQAQFTAVMGHNPSRHTGPSVSNADSRPVEEVEWADAVAFCVRLTQLEGAAGRVPAGYEYRLPTEAEWEYCCRAGSTTDFAFGASLQCSQANFYDQNANGGQQPSPCVLDPTTGNGQTWVSSAFAPNAFGLCSMHGNVGEWVLDEHPSSTGAPYPVGPVTDPVVRGGAFRMSRGGAWFYPSQFSRSACRVGSPLRELGLTGFRAVLAPILP